jgi:hypothetical protein
MKDMKLNDNIVKALDLISETYCVKPVSIEAKIERALWALVDLEALSYARMTSAREYPSILIQAAERAIKQCPDLTDKEIIELLKKDTVRFNNLYFAGHDDNTGMMLIKMLRAKILIEDS